MAPPTTTTSEPLPRGWARLICAYSVTIRVILSYYFLRLRLRLAGPDAQSRLLLEAHRRNAQRIHLAIERLGGLFIKVGQLISIMTNVLPEPFRAQLETLQDRVPARPYADIAQRFAEEFSGRGPSEVFTSFSPEPVASASIGQVHRAVTHDGQAVAVKVQYPDINEIVRIDLAALGRIFWLLHWIAPAHGLDAVFVEIRSMVMQELDFSAEASSLQRISENFGRYKPPLPVEFPKVISELSTPRVLTTTWMDGIKVSNLTRLDELGIDRDKLARTVVTAYCQQIFRDGLYHADPHPGNLLVLPPRSDGSEAKSSPEADAVPTPWLSLGGAKLVFLDFGAVAELSPKMRRGIVDVLQAGLTRDTQKLIVAMKDMGFIARGADPQIFERVVDFFHDKFQAEFKLDSLALSEVKLSPERALADLADLRKLDVNLRDLMEHFHVPKEWILLERTLLLLLGLCTDLAPNLNPMQVIRPYVEEMVLGQDRDWSKLLVETTRDVVSQAAQLPGELRKFLHRAQRGQIEVRFRGQEDTAILIHAVARQLIVTALGITSFVTWLILDARGQLEQADWALYVSMGLGAYLLWLMLTTKLPRRR
ncbi:MAG: AarF/ABC1/UbiB kinase family protein [Myxococcales bacterium]|nr:AarF/ABC1/UbiB kinase family protein [Myxococcales bacterium]